MFNKLYRIVILSERQDVQNVRLVNIEQ